MILRFNSRTGPMAYEIEFPPAVRETDYGEISYVFKIKNVGVAATMTLTEAELVQLCEVKKVRRQK